jgi:membrane peptidoglycan carboxypeptidase
MLPRAPLNKSFSTAFFGRRHGRLRRRRRQSAARGSRRHVAFMVMAFTLLAMFFGTASAAWSVGPLPSIAGMSTSALPQDLLIYDRNGTLIADIGDKGSHRIVVPLASMTPSLVEATVAVEDRTYYQNRGIDPAAIARAAFDDLIHLRFVEGGSTITQQLVRQLYFGPNAPDTLRRKLREAVLAVNLTSHYSKNEILAMYLNTIYFGSQAYGVEAAAQTYFHTSASKLTLAQSTLLAGLPRSPSAFNPVLHPQAARQRQAQVLAAMVRQGNISQAQASAAARVPLQVFPPASSIKAPYFVDYVLTTLSQQYHITAGSGRGYRVTTSLDLTLQGQAEAAVTAQVAHAGGYYNFHDAGLVSMQPQTGKILAMVGGTSYNAPGGQINMATSPTRQVGSAFKIFTYSAALESQKVNMESPILDAPLVFPIGGPGNGPYAPTNYDAQWHGTLPLKMALGNSLNIPALKAELLTGIPAVLDTARRMGATTLTQPDSTYGPSLTLGAYPVSMLDMAVGTSTLADLGVRHRPAPILEINDATGHSVYSYDPAQNAFQAISPQIAFIMASILSDDSNRCMSFGCNSDLTLGARQVAAKTGTSEGFRDNWTLGFTPSLATVAWVGNPDNTPLSHNSTGIVGAAPIWHQFMTQALQAVPNTWYGPPDGLDQFGGDYYLPGTEFLSPVLADPWPACPAQSYDPKTTSWSQLLVNGVPCAIVTGERIRPFA